MKTRTMGRFVIALATLVMVLFVGLASTPVSAATHSVPKLDKKYVVPARDIKQVKLNKKTDYYIVIIKKDRRNGYYKQLKKAVKQAQQGKKKVKLSIPSGKKEVKFWHIAEVKKNSKGNTVVCIGDCAYPYYEKLAKKYK